MTGKHLLEVELNNNNVCYGQHSKPISEYQLLTDVGIVISADSQEIHLWRITDSAQLLVIDYKESLSRLLELIISKCGTWMILHYETDTGNYGYDELMVYHLSSEGVKKLDILRYEDSSIEVGFKNLKRDSSNLIIQGINKDEEPKQCLEEYTLDSKNKTMIFKSESVMPCDNEIEWGENAFVLYDFIDIER